MRDGDSSSEAGKVDVRPSYLLEKSSPTTNTRGSRSSSLHSECSSTVVLTTYSSSNDEPQTPIAGTDGTGYVG